jgi:hypothetical protein
MSDPRRFVLDELTIRAGTYFNPETEILIVVDDSADVDHELFDSSEFESTEWVLVSEETPVDEDRRDELIEHFRATYRPGGELDGEDEGDEDELDDDEDEDEEEDDEGVDELEIE